MKESNRFKIKILKAGVKVWPDTRLMTVAKKAGMTHPGVLHHFPDDTLKANIIEYARAKGLSKIIVELMAGKHDAIKNLSVADRIKHFNAI